MGKEDNSNFPSVVCLSVPENFIIGREQSKL